MKNGYSAAWDFSEGLAAVKRDGKIGFINAQNEVVIPFQFERAPLCDMEIYFLFHDDYCSMTIANGKIGLIDKKGEWVIKPIYDELWAPKENGHRIIINDDKYGALDAQFSVAYPAEYDHKDITSEGMVLAKDSNMWKVDLRGMSYSPIWLISRCISNIQMAIMTAERSYMPLPII